MVGIYSVVVLAVGQALKPVFSNLQGHIMFTEMQDTTYPYQLVRDIYLARADGELMVEELSYQELIALYRDPHMLSEMTSHKAKQD